MANGTRIALFFDVFARNRSRGTFAEIIKSTDTLRGKIAAVGKLAAGAAVAGLAVFAGQGVRSFLQFDDQMTQSLAIMGEVAGPMRKRMEDAARAVGRTTRFGADEAAEAYFFLASAGLDAEQSVSALPQVAKFAQAGMFDLARATDLATDAQSALGLSVENPEQNLRNLTRVTDTLVGANTLANASVEQFSTSLTQKAGPAMRQAGIEIEEGVAALAVFADQGIKSERAGTLFAAMLEQLQRRAIQSADEFERFNIQVFDQQGNLRNMADIVADLEVALGGMSLEQQKATLLQLGFNRSALDGILALIGSSDALRGYQTELEAAGGITEEVAEKQLQSFAARLDLIKSRVMDAGMVVGEVLITAVFNVGEHIGEMVRMFDQLPGGVQVGIGALAALAAAAPLAIGAFRKVRAAIESVRLSLLAMSATARTATLAAGGIGLVLAAGATILAFFANKNLEAKQRVDALADSLDKQTATITANSREVALNNLQQSGAIEKAKELGINLETLVDAYLGDKDAIAEVNAVLAENIDKTEERTGSGNATISVLTDEAKAARDVKDAVSEGNETTDAAISKARDRIAAGVGVTESEEEMAAATEDATGAIEEEVSAVEELISTLEEATQTIFAARDAERGYEQAVDDAKVALKENGTTLDINTEKGRNNQRQLDRLAESALKDAEATLEDAEAKGDLAAGHDRATAKMKTARAEFVKVARQMGLSKQEANALADELGLIPGNYKANVSAPGASSAAQSVASLNSQLANIPRSVSTTVTARGVIVGQSAAFRTGGRALVMQHGGMFRHGDVALVGEQGPELVRFQGSGEVLPADETRRALNGSGGGMTSGGSASFQIINQGVIGSQREVEDWLTRSLDNLRRKGRLS